MLGASAPGRSARSRAPEGSLFGGG